MGISYFEQSHKDYPSTGEFIDYAYMQYNIPALTLEISKSRKGTTEERLSSERLIKGTLAYIEALRSEPSFDLAH